MLLNAQTSQPEHKLLFCSQQLIDFFPQTAPVLLNLNRGSQSRLDMTSLQQVAQFVPRVFNHQDCHHNGWVNQWLIKEGPSVPTSQIRCVYASNGLETERRTVSPLFLHLMGLKHQLQATWDYEELEGAKINQDDIFWMKGPKVIAKVRVFSEHPRHSQGQT